MENVLVKMAAGESDIVRSFSLILSRIPDNFHGCTLDDIETDACAAAMKDYSSSDESDVVEDGVLNPRSNSNESSDSAIGSLDSGPEESDPCKKYVDRYDSNESSERSSSSFGSPSPRAKSEYDFANLANVFKNSILQSADYECDDDLDAENADCEDDGFVESTCSSEGCGETSVDLFWRANFKKTCDQKDDIESFGDTDNDSLLQTNRSSPCSRSSDSNDSCNDAGSTACNSSLTPNSGPQSPENESVVDSISECRENIRFPFHRKTSCLSERLCRWSGCVDHISTSSNLLEHLQTKHVNPQTFSETFMCSWIDCKVYGKPSCSRTWLERHVLSHVGNKPYKCIVESCGQRFNSQSMLERHINQHFKTQDCTDGVTETATKLIRRNGQKLRYRRQLYSVRSRTDVFDAGTMSQLQFLLVQMAHRSENVSLNILDSRNFLHVSFQPKVIGCRQEMNGNVKYLIRWYPYNALEDEWLPKSEIENTRNVPIWKLPASVQHLFWDSIFPNERSSVRRPRKYKADSCGNP